VFRPLLRACRPQKSKEAKALAAANSSKVRAAPAVVAALLAAPQYCARTDPSVACLVLLAGSGELILCQLTMFSCSEEPQQQCTHA
jgi:hypothetical protein